MRRLFVVAVAAAALSALAHCSKDYGEDSPPAEAGAGETSTADGAPATDANDAGDAATFCTTQTKATFCEDFEGPFPPPMWTTELLQGGVVRRGPGFESAGGLEAEVVGPTTGIALASLARAFTFAATSKRLYVRARVFVERHDPVEGLTPVVQVSLGGAYFFMLSSVSAEAGTVSLEVAAGDGGGAPRIDIAWPVRKWMLYEGRIERNGGSVTESVAIDGVGLGGGTGPSIDVSGKKIAIGVGVPAGLGFRIARIDDVVVTVE